MFRILALAAPLALVACVHSTPITGPNGMNAYLIDNCGSMRSCFKEAAVKCPKGYVPISTGSAGGGGFGHISPTGQIWMMDDTEYHLIVECK